MSYMLGKEVRMGRKRKEWVDRTPREKHNIIKKAAPYFRSNLDAASYRIVLSVYNSRCDEVGFDTIRDIVLSRGTSYLSEVFL